MDEPRDTDDVSALAQPEAPGPVSEAGDGEPSPAPSRPPPSRLRHLVTRLGLVGAVMAVLYVMAPAVPRDHPVEVRLGDASAVTAVDMAWSRADEAGDEPIRGGSWTFAPGRAPSSIHNVVRLPSGRYKVAVEVARAEARTSVEREVSLEGDDPITLIVPASRH